jgi:cephalosporin hydroxylase
MNPHEEFQEEVQHHIDEMAQDSSFQGLSNIWIRTAGKLWYDRTFSWLGRPIIQYPQDIYAMQELIWKIKPDLIIETGIAHGGSLIMSASMLALIDYCAAAQNNSILNPQASSSKVLGIDIDIRQHNKEAISSHPLAHKIDMIQGSSIDPATIAKVQEYASRFQNVLVFLDSNHTHEHVLAELEAYAPMVSMGSYCVVWDTIVEDVPAGFCVDRPWDKGNSPKTAVWEYMRQFSKGPSSIGSDGSPLLFAIDKKMQTKLSITAAPDGFLQRQPLPKA